MLIEGLEGSRLQVFGPIEASRFRLLVQGCWSFKLSGLGFRVLGLMRPESRWGLRTLVSGLWYGAEHLYEIKANG